jgi:hypothetical protein
MAVDFTARDWMEGMTMSLFSLKDTTRGHTVQYSSRLLASDKVFNKYISDRYFNVSGATGQLVLYI